MVRRKDKAMQQLQLIERLCGGSSCDEWRDLDAAIRRQSP
jgi:hypothetical protein